MLDNLDFQLCSVADALIKITADRTMLQVEGYFGEQKRRISTGNFCIYILGHHLEDVITQEFIRARGIDLPNPITEGCKVQGYDS